MVKKIEKNIKKTFFYDPWAHFVEVPKYDGTDDDYQGVAGLGPAPSICDCCEPGLVGQHPDCVKALWEVLIMMMVVMIKIMMTMTLTIMIAMMVNDR